MPMPHVKHAPVRLRFAALDFVLAAAAYLLAAWVWEDVGVSVYLLYEGGAASIALIALSIVAAGSFQGVYAILRQRSRIALALDLTAVMGAAFLLQAVIHYVHRDLAAPLPIMLTGSVFAIAALFAWRLVLLRSFGVERILLVGSSPLNRQIAACIASRPECGMRVVGYLDDGLPRHSLLDGVSVAGGIEDLLQLRQDLDAHRVVIDLEGAEQRLPAALVKRIVAAGLMLEKPTVLYEALFGRILACRIQPSAAFLDGELGFTPTRAAAQSVYTNVLALAALTAAAPLIALIAVLEKLTSREPVFETRRIAGWNLIPFTLLRFRCRDSSGRFTLLGRSLRRLHLDALPQLWNVLRGEMALVGPRPVPAETAAALLDVLPCYRLRFAIKPGMVGWSRIHMQSGSGDPAIELEYDLYYVKHLSMALDCYIVWSTVRSLFQRREAAEPPPAAAAKRAAHPEH